jgi:hypothetical protein
MWPNTNAQFKHTLNFDFSRFDAFNMFWTDAITSHIIDIMKESNDNAYISANLTNNIFMRFMTTQLYLYIHYEMKQYKDIYHNGIKDKRLIFHR